MVDSDSDTPLFGPERGRKRAADSDDDIPLFGPMSRAAKMQKPCPPEDYLKEEVAGLSQEELNAGAVDEAELRLGVVDAIYYSLLDLWVGAGRLTSAHCRVENSKRLK